MQHYNFSKCHKTILCVQVTSARWQNRKSQASFPSRKSNLRTIYGPKTLYNNSMNQSESCSTLGKLKAQNKCLKRGGEINFIATMSVPPSTWHYSPMGGKSLLAAFPLQGRENSGTSISAMTFQGAAHGSGFCPTRCRALMRNQNTLGCLGAAENKKEFSSCGNTREPVILQKETDTALCIQEKVPSLWLLPASNILALGRAAWGTGLCLRWLRALTDMANFEYLGGHREHTRTQVSFSSAKESAVPWTDTRGIKRQESPEKETGKPLSLEKHMYKPRDYTFPKKFWEAPQISSLADWWSSFPVWCKSVKVERNDFLFQMHTSQHTATSHMKKQGNMAQSKDENKSPETKPQITEIYEFELPKKEFNITIIKNSIWSKRPL